MRIKPWLAGARHVPTTKCSAARRRVEAIILHISASPPSDIPSDMRRIDRWAYDRNHKSSTHVVVHRDGSIDQMVPLDMRAWHAGRRSVLFGNPREVNQRTIGIDLMSEGPLTRARLEWYVEDGRRTRMGPDGRWWEDIPSAQLDALAIAIIDIRDALGRPALPILGHSDVAPLHRPDCPGVAVPWAWLREAVDTRSCPSEVV